MFNATVQGGTHAGWRRLKTPGVDKCACGGFISQTNAAAGQTKCATCRKEDS